MRKQGFLSGSWTLEAEGLAVASAQKQAVLRRIFDLEDGESRFVLRPIPGLGAGFQLDEGGRQKAKIVPVHFFTRRSTITTTGEPPAFSTLVFAFWLVALMGRRDSQSSG